MVRDFSAENEIPEVEVIDPGGAPQGLGNRFFGNIPGLGTVQRAIQPVEIVDDEGRPAMMQDDAGIQAASKRHTFA